MVFPFTPVHWPVTLTSRSGKSRQDWTVPVPRQIGFDDRPVDREGGGGGDQTVQSQNSQRCSISNFCYCTTNKEAQQAAEERRKEGQARRIRNQGVSNLCDKSGNFFLKAHDVVLMKHNVCIRHHRIPTHLRPEEHQAVPYFTLFR